MNTKKILAMLLAVVMIVGIMAGCAADEPAESPEDSTEASGEGVDISVCLASEPESIDPALNKAVDGAMMLNHFFEGLLKWQDNGTEINDEVNGAELVAGQAESWEKVKNEDGTVTYTFKLREDAKWSDGEPVTADDFVYAWQRLATPATGAEYTYMIDMVKGYDEVFNGVGTGEYETVEDEETGEEKEKELMENADPTTLAVSAPDDHTFVVTLSNDCPYFLEICAFPATFPVRQDILEENGDQWTFEPATYVSNGPFKMEEWKHNAFIKVVKNDNYYDTDNVTTNSITFQLMDDNSAMLSAFDSGTLQYIEKVPVDEVSTRLANDDLKIVDQIGTYYTCFNTEKAPFDDPRVREAFSLAIDRNYIVENVSQAGELPATAYVPAGMYDAEGPNGDDFRTVGGEYYSVDPDEYEANCEKARELLADAGFPNGEGFPAVEYLYNTDDNHKAIGEALQQMWQTELGVSVTLNNQEWGVFQKTRQDGNYQIARNGWLADYNDPCCFLDMWYTNNGNNDAQYSNPDYDALIDAAKSTDVPADRMQALHDAEDLLIGQDKVLAPIYFYTRYFLLDDSIEGMYYTPLGFFFFGHLSETEA